MKAPNVTAGLCFWTTTLPKLGKAAIRLSDNLSSDASAVSTAANTLQPHPGKEKLLLLRL